MINFKQVRENVELVRLTEDEFSRSFSNQELDYLNDEIAIANHHYHSIGEEPYGQDDFCTEEDLDNLDYELDIMRVAHYLISTLYGEKHSDFVEELE